MNSEYYKEAIARNARKFLHMTSESDSEEIALAYLGITENVESMSRTVSTSESAQKLRDTFESLRTDPIREVLWDEKASQVDKDQALSHLKKGIDAAAELVKNI